MSAKEMFEKCLYNLKEDSKYYLIYTNDEFDIDYSPSYAKTIYRIVFVKEKKIIQICNDNGSYFITCDKELIQAINKQIEELGW